MKIAVVLIAAMLALCGPAIAATDYYLKIDGVDGEARRGAFNGWIALRGFSLESETSSITFGDGIRGTRPPADSSGGDGDPDRPLIVGRVANPQTPEPAQYNETDIEFVTERARARQAIQSFCTKSNTAASAEIRIVENGVQVRSFRAVNLTCVRSVGGGVIMRASCIEETDHRTNRSSPACASEAPASKDVRLKGKKILEN